MIKYYKIEKILWILVSRGIFKSSRSISFKHFNTVYKKIGIMKYFLLSAITFFI